MSKRDKKKYRILHISAHLNMGGTEKWLIRLIRHWDSEVFDPAVISFEGGELETELADLSIAPIIIKKPPGHHFRFIYDLVKTFRQLKPDLVHCRNAMPVIIYGGLAAKIARRRLVVSIHGHGHLVGDELKDRIFYRIQNLSDSIIAVSESIKRSLISTGYISPDKITVIYNGIDLSWIKHENRDKKRAKLGIDSSDMAIGCVGNLRKVKGHRYLIQAMPLVLKKFPGARLVVVGNGKLRDELEALAGEIGVTDRVNFLGNRDDVYEIMTAFDIFALPSLSEGMANVLLEAMAAGKPIVATNVGGNPEVLKDGKVGLLVPPQDPTAMADAISRLLADKDRREEMGKAAFLRIESEFQLSRTIKRYEEVYLNVIEGRKGSA